MGICELNNFFSFELKTNHQIPVYEVEFRASISKSGIFLIAIGNIANIIWLHVFDALDVYRFAKINKHIKIGYKFFWLLL